MKIVFISDVHTKYDDLQITNCDILISSGDYSFGGKPNEVRGFHEWFNRQLAFNKISVQGNHELWVEDNFYAARLIAQEACPDVHFIDEGLVEIGNLKIWCSSISPWFYDWAWNRARGNEIKRHWDLIPNDVDIIVTHGPPYGILDKVNGNHVGCEDLLNRIKDIKPLIWAGGHIHEGRGVHEFNGTTFINASVCDELYAPIHSPIEVELTDDKKIIKITR